MEFVAAQGSPAKPREISPSLSNASLIPTAPTPAASSMSPVAHRALGWRSSADSDVAVCVTDHVISDKAIPEIYSMLSVGNGKLESTVECSPSLVSVVRRDGYHLVLDPGVIGVIKARDLVSSRILVIQRVPLNVRVWIQCLRVVEVSLPRVGLGEDTDAREIAPRVEILEPVVFLGVASELVVVLGGRRAPEVEADVVEAIWAVRLIPICCQI